MARYRIQDKKRDEEFEADGSDELIKAFRLLRAKELKEIEEQIRRMTDELKFTVLTQTGEVVSLDAQIKWTFDADKEWD